MSDWTKIAIDNALHFFELSILALFGWIIKDTFFKPLKSNQELIVKHIEECNKVPKILLQEQIKNVSERVTNLDSKIDDMGKDIKELIKR